MRTQCGIAHINNLIVALFMKQYTNLQIIMKYICCYVDAGRNDLVLFFDKCCAPKHIYIFIYIYISASLLGFMQMKGKEVEYEEHNFILSCGTRIHLWWWLRSFCFLWIFSGCGGMIFWRMLHFANVASGHTSREVKVVPNKNIIRPYTCTCMVNVTVHMLECV